MQKTKLRLPFDGEWFVFWGGEDIESNAHYENQTQKHAIDFVMVDKSGQTHKGPGAHNKDYYCFNQEILAPADGEVVEVVDGVRDNTPGDTNPYFLPGNYALIKHSQDEFSFIAHLKKNTLAVRVGDQVQAGQLVGRCGNSGNSGEPHLHYHLQDSFIFARYDDNYERQYIAKGIKIEFEKIEVDRQQKDSYSPVKNDRAKQL